MFSEWDATWPGDHDRSGAWENLYDDGSRLDRLAHRSELLRLDECGPAVEDGYVL